MSTTGFTGSQIYVDLVSPTIVDISFNYAPVTVGEEVELPGLLASLLSIDLDDTTIAFVDFFNDFSFFPSDFAGFSFSDEDGSIPDFVNVTLDTNVAGLDASDLTFEANRIFLNLTGVRIYSDSLITLTVTFAEPNADPVAVDDVGSTDQNTALATDVLGNDTDADDDTLTVTEAEVTSGFGTATVLENGDVYYDPNGAYDGLATGETATVTISYVISDGEGGTDEGELTVEVSGLSGETRTGTNRSETITGTGGDDTVFGGNGRDVIQGLDDADRLLGGNDDDAIFGGRGSDWLFGGNGRDLLDGGLGDDIVESGQGNDRLAGGSGADEFRFGLNGGADVIEDFVADEDSIRLLDGVRLTGVRLVDTDGTGGADSTRLLLSSGSVLLQFGLYAAGDLTIL